MLNKRILDALMIAGSVAAALALAGCSPAPAPIAPTTPPAKHAEHPAPSAKDDLTVAGPSSASKDTAGAPEERQNKKVAEPAESSPPPPPPQGAPPSWLTKTPAPYRAGDAAQYLPKDCNDRRFIDVAGIVGSSASELRAVFERALKGKAASEESWRVKKALAIIIAAGVDPISNWREIAICGNGRNVVAIGIAQDKPLEVPLLAQKVKVALGDDPGVVKREGDVSMLVSPDDEVVAQPAPQVFLVSRDKDALLEGIHKKAGGPGFTAARGYLFFGKASEVEVTVKQSGDKLNVGLLVHLPQSAGEEAKKDPKGVTSKLGGRVKGLADRLKGTPFEPVGERIRAANVAVRGADATITGSIQRSSLLSILKGLELSELEGLLPLLK